MSNQTPANAPHGEIELLRRMLSTPPKPHAAKSVKPQSKKTKKPAK